MPGQGLPVSGRAVLFNACTCLHTVQPWTGGNRLTRLTLLAYSIGQHLCLREAHRSQLAALGFTLPEGLSSKGRGALLAARGAACGGSHPSKTCVSHCTALWKCDSVCSHTHMVLTMVDVSGRCMA